MAAAALVAIWPATTAAAPSWEAWQVVSGVFDLGGPRADGSLVVAGSGALYTLDPEGTAAPFARGPGGYRDDPGTEAYLAVSPGLHVASAACDFAKDDVFVLRLHTPFGVTRVSAAGDQTGPFDSVALATLNGIAFDTTGTFQRRLLVTGPLNGKTEVVAIDCTGASQTITKTAPVVEGGLAVAPRGFGAFGGDLIMPDELGGVIWALAPDGTVTKVVDSGVAHGQDIGVESVAFVPAGFSRGGYLYYSDRSTTGNPHPGTDHILRLGSADLVAVGVQDGDLLSATEGGAALIDVRCAVSCQVTQVIATPTTAHGEGHLVFTLNKQASPTPSAVSVTTRKATASTGSGGIPVAAFLPAILLAAAAGALIALAVMRRRR